MNFWRINRIDENGNHITGYQDEYMCGLYTKEEAIEAYEYCNFIVSGYEPFLYEVELIEE